jgi:hypothetical protein
MKSVWYDIWVLIWGVFLWHCCPFPFLYWYYYIRINLNAEWHILWFHGVNLYIHFFCSFFLKFVGSEISSFRQSFTFRPLLRQTFGAQLITAPKVLKVLLWISVSGSFSTCDSVHLWHNTWFLHTCLVLLPICSVCY